jgi:hypothetical protein
MRSEVIFKKWITVKAVRDSAGAIPAKEWFNSLELRDRMRAEAGLTNFDATERVGIRSTGRIEPVKGRRRGMRELKLTRGGSTGPQLRMIGEMRGRTFFAALGFHKKQRRIPASVIARAESILEAGLPDGTDNDKRAG